MRPLPKKEQLAILKSLEEQGCEIVDKKDGWRINFPDGHSSTSLHKSHGDLRARENLRAAVRRAGLKWPFDHHQKKKGT